MIETLPTKDCANLHCYQKLNNGNNTGGWKATRTTTGWQTGYTCKHCSSQSTPGTQKLALFQQTQQYNNIVNNEIEHKRKWQKIVNSLHKEEKEEAQISNSNNTPNWNDVLDGIEKKRREASK